MIDEFSKEPGKNLLALHVYFEKKRMFRHFLESLGRNLSVQKYLDLETFYVMNRQKNKNILKVKVKVLDFLEVFRDDNKSLRGTLKWQSKFEI